jgi:hypothetical protein
MNVSNIGTFEFRYCFGFTFYLGQVIYLLSALSRRDNVGSQQMVEHQT